MTDQRSVLLLYNQPRGDALGAWREADAGVLDEVKVVSESLHRLGIRSRQASVRSLADIVGAVATGFERVVFNLVESLDADPLDMNLVPAVCRALGRYCTGGDTPCLSVTMDKGQAKAALSAWGVRTPQAVVVPANADPASFAYSAPPLIVKPLSADASEGIQETSVVDRVGEALFVNIRKIHADFRQPALVESYIDGKELNVSVMQRGNEVEVLAIAEIDFSTFPANRPRIVDYAAKWLPQSFAYQNTPRRIPADLSEPIAAQVRDVALRAWRAVDCRDYARVDMRVDSAGRVFVIEVNANPDLSPDCGYSAALGAAGYSFDRFVLQMVENALGRHAASLQAPVPLVPAPEHGAHGHVHIRPTESGDRDAILRFALETEFFRPDELEVATEVLDDSIQFGTASGYHSYTALLDGAAVGWVCFGPTACTLATFDVYWIVCDRRAQSRGLGKQLMRLAEERIAGMRGRLVIVETAGREQYEPTRRFYKRLGYVAEARLADFYGPGDDKIVFTKRLG